MSRLKILFGAMFVFASFMAQGNPLWMRYPSISPDGKEVAFSYKGDIYTVSSEGGEARQITRHEAYDYRPIWSPDGKQIAFASNRYGNFDVYLVSAKGGNPVRLTTNSANESPYSFTPDGKYVAFDAAIQVPAVSALFPNRLSSQLYQVSVDGGRAELLMPIPSDNISFRKDGKAFLYQNRKGFENKFRKHHTSSVTRDIWLYDAVTKKHAPLIQTAGEHADPVWAPDNNRFYFLSEQGGTFNVYSSSTANPEKVEKITSFKTHPVRSLSIAADGTLCFGYDGELYIKKTNGNPHKLKISIVAEETLNNQLRLLNTGLRSTNVSSDGKQIAVEMRGEIFVSSVDYKYTKRITQTPEGEAGASFSPDGKTLVYASARNGMWDLYTAEPLREEEKNFYNATLIEEKILLKSSKFDRTTPQYSPDGKEIAYIEDRCRLMVYNIEKKEIRQVTDGQYHPSSAGDIKYEWSPDSKWFTIQYTANKHEPYHDIGLVNAKTGDIVNLTNSGYMNLNPRWTQDGNTIIFITDRYGMRNHASWGSQYDVMAVFLNQKAYDEFQLSKDEAAILKEEKKAAEKDKKNDEKKEDDKKDKNETKGDSKDNIIIDLKNIEDRIVRLTPNSANISDAILTKENKLYYTAAFEKGHDLWSIDCRTRDIKLEVKDLGRGTLVLSKDEKELFLLGSSTNKITLAGNKKETISHQAELNMDLAAERRYMFEHVWQQEKRRFYTKEMHGVNWDLLKKEYVKFLPHINNNFDFSEMLSEILGELNVSHTGSGYRYQHKDADATADLGILIDQHYNKDGILIEEILEKGPFDRAESKVTAGCIIEKIDGERILSGKDYYPLLNRKAGRRVLVSVYDPQTNERWEEIIKPIASSADLLYKRWIKQRAADVERLSGGRLGYVHIQSMGDPSFRSVYADILGKYNDKEGIVIDTRFNGGGRLHEDIEVLFSGKKYFTQVIRGQESCDMPSRRWNKPSIMLMNEANYSNAHGTPWVYKHTGIGKLVGMPVPGTMTSVSWETLQDPSLYFGIPIVGYRLEDGSYLENQQLEPDVKVANSPENLLQGKDEQLEMAVKVLLAELD